MSKARDGAIGTVVATLNRIGAIGDPDQLYDYAEAAVDALATVFAPDPQAGWLISGGNIHQVSDAEVQISKSDRLGWYVSTSREPGDDRG